MAEPVVIVVVAVAFGLMALRMRSLSLSRRAAEARYDLIADHLPRTALAVFDRDLRLQVLAGPALTDTAAPREEVEGRLVTDVVVGERGRWLAGLYRSALDGETRSVEYESEADGRHYWLRIVPIREDDGEVVGGLAATLDVTERVRAEEALAASEHRARLEAERLSSEFFAQVAHELGTPLTALAVNLELLAAADGPRMSSEGRSLLEVMDHETRRLERLVRDMRVAAQVKSGHFTIARERIRISAVVASAVASVRPLADAKSIDLELLSDEIPPSAGDPDRIGQAVDNLLSNAVKYTPEGGRVTVRVRRIEHMARIEIEDTGQGIPESEKERIFQRFERGVAENPHEVFGMGLGLAIATTIVEAHGGRITLDSEAGAGSTFGIDLPLEPIADPRGRFNHRPSPSRLAKIAG